MWMKGKGNVNIEDFYALMLVLATMCLDYQGSNNLSHSEASLFLSVQVSLKTTDCPLMKSQESPSFAGSFAAPQPVPYRLMGRASA